MGLTGTDVAKETAHVIITDDILLLWLVQLSKEETFFHIKNVIKYLLAGNIGKVIYMILAVIFQLPILTALNFFILILLPTEYRPIPLLYRQITVII